MKRTAAFTLIELLVVIAIIAVLTALLLPSLQRARTQARLLKCLSGARQVYLSVQMYSNDFKHWLPHGWSVLENDPVRNPSRLPPLWHVTLVKLGYMNRELQSRKAGCPDGPPPFEEMPPAIRETWWQLYESDHYTHPNMFYGDPYSHVTHASYGLNGFLQSGYAHNGVTYQHFGPYKTSSLPFRRHGTKIGLIFCVCVPWAANTETIWPPIDYTIGKNIHYLRYPNGTLRPIGGRHEKTGIPVVYCDGHAEVVPPNGIQVFPAPTPTKPLMWWSYWYLLFRRIAENSF